MRKRRGRVLTAIGMVVALIVGGGGVMYVRARALFDRIEVLGAGPTGRRVSEAGVFANYFPSTEPGRRPGILLIGGSEGGLGSGARDAALELQRAGYSVLTPAYFGAPGQPRHLERIPLETFDRALAWMAAQPEVDPGRLVLAGVSKGAEAALLVATRHPELKAVVAGVPSSAVWPGIKFGTLNTKSSWTLAGRPLAYLPYGPLRLRMLTGDIGVVYRDGIKKFGAHPDAQIPIDRITAPVLLVCGENDRLWPSCVMSRQLEARATREGGPPVTVLAYRDAGHGSVGPPLKPNDPHYNDLGFMGGSVAGNNAARADSWPKLLEFMHAALGDVH